MAPKVDFFYPFDKGFFGKTLAQAAKQPLPEGFIPSKLKLDSIDDLVKYFDSKLFSPQPLERSPKVDKVVIKQPLAANKDFDFWGY